VLADLLRLCIGVAPRPLGETPQEAESGTSRRAELPEHLREVIVAARNAALISVFVEPDLATPGRDDSSAVPDYDVSQIGNTLLELFLDELGLFLPVVKFEADSALGEGRFRIQVNDLRFPPLQGLLADEALVAASVDDLARRGIVARKATNPMHGGEAGIISADESDMASLRADGYVILRPRAFVAFSARRELQRLAGSLLLPDVLMFQLKQLRNDDSVVVEAALQRFDRYLLTAVFRRLLDEEVPIRDGVGVLEGMLAVGSSISVDESVYDLIAPDAASLWLVPEGTEPIEPSVDQYADCVRRHLRWQVTRGFVDTVNRLRAFSVDKRLESRIRQSRPLDEDERAVLRASVWAIYEPLAQSGSVVVALTNSEVRRELRRLLEKDFPTLHVLSGHEIAPGTEVKRIGEITWA
jgi:flagellar biosynthesis component FlhA